MIAEWTEEKETALAFCPLLPPHSLPFLLFQVLAVGFIQLASSDFISKRPQSTYQGFETFLYVIQSSSL